MVLLTMASLSPIESKSLPLCLWATSVMQVDKSAYICISGSPDSCNGSDSFMGRLIFGSHFIHIGFGLSSALAAEGNYIVGFETVYQSPEAIFIFLLELLNG